MSTPNGRRETHAMATEFQMHPAGIVEAGGVHPGISSLVFLRLTAKQAKSVGKGKAIPLMHYTGPKKIIPLEIHRESAIQRCVLRKPVLLQCRRRTRSGLTVRAKEMMPWNGFNNHLAKIRPH